MVMVINYIFESSQASSEAIKSMKKTLRDQARFNRMLTIFAFTVTTYAFMVKIHNYEQDNKIEELINEIEELKRMKGE